MVRSTPDTLDMEEFCAENFAAVETERREKEVEEVLQHVEM